MMVVGFPSTLYACPFSHYHGGESHFFTHRVGTPCIGSINTPLILITRGESIFIISVSLLPQRRRNYRRETMNGIE